MKIPSCLWPVLFALATHSGPSVAQSADVANLATYVAMGSSYAAGPGIGLSADVPPNRCGRSTRNYAHQLAQRHHLNLRDVSCSGATTADILGPWGELPPQLEAVTPRTTLVTVTVGGNDLNYVGDLAASACRAARPVKADCPPIKWPDQADYDALEHAFLMIVAQIRQRSPSARIVFVEYPAVLPISGNCTKLGIADADADALRALAYRLAATTERAGRQANVEVLPFAAFSEAHNACAGDPWMTGLMSDAGRRSKVPFHPNLAAMTTIADELDRELFAVGASR